MWQSLDSLLLAAGENAMLSSGLFTETSGYVTAPKLWCIFRCFMHHGEN